MPLTRNSPFHIPLIALYCILLDNMLLTEDVLASMRIGCVFKDTQSAKETPQTPPVIDSLDMHLSADLMVTGT